MALETQPCSESLWTFKKDGIRTLKWEVGNWENPVLNTVNSNIAQTSLKSFRVRDIKCHKPQQKKPTVGEAYSKLSRVQKCRFSNICVTIR